MARQKHQIRSIFLGTKQIKIIDALFAFGILWAWGLVPRKDAKMGAPVQPARRGWFQCCMGVPRSGSGYFLNIFLMIFPTTKIFEVIGCYC